MGRGPSAVAATARSWCGPSLQMAALRRLPPGRPPARSHPWLLCGQSCPSFAARYFLRGARQSGGPLPLRAAPVLPPRPSVIRTRRPLGGRRGSACASLWGLVFCGRLAPPAGQEDYFPGPPLWASGAYRQITSGGCHPFLGFADFPGKIFSICLTLGPLKVAARLATSASADVTHSREWASLPFVCRSTVGAFASVVAGDGHASGRGAAVLAVSLGRITNKCGLR